MDNKINTIPKIAIFGASGLLGSHAVNYFNGRGYEVVSTYNSHFLDFRQNRSVHLDVQDLNATKAFLLDYKPNILINCTGLTSVEDCEKNEKHAQYIHVTFPREIADLTANESILNIHISTDHLWDGKKSFYTELESPNPVNVYGKTKAKGEIEVLKQNPNSMVIRSNFFGSGNSWRQSFSDWVIAKLREPNEFYGFEDLYFTPISIPLLLGFINDLISNRFSGIIHLAGSERISKYEFIIKMAKILKLNYNHLVSRQYSLTNREVMRPLDMSLSSVHFSKIFKVTPPDVEYSIRSIL